MDHARSQIEINVGRLCNNACVFCANGALPAGERTQVGREVIEGELRRRAAEGYTSLGFLGGEPTIYPGIEEVIATARGLGFTRIALCTNGRRLADAARLLGLAKAGVTRVMISIHSHETAVEDALSRRRGAFAQKLAAIDHCVDAAARGFLPDGFSLNTCIHGRNVGALDELARFFHARGVRDIRFNLMRPAHEAIGDAALIPRLRDVADAALRLVIANERALRMTVTFGDIPLCAWPASFLDRAALAGRYLGELRDLETDVTFFHDKSRGWTPDRFAWKGRRAGVLKARPKACQACGARGICEGPFAAYLDLYGDGEFRPLPADARTAEGGKARRKAARR